ncbi:hypothetical protein [Streptomyces halobius]|nr:hypothetical protein [Streptomyces halobius]
MRLLCTPCYSAATLTEDAGHAVDWTQARAYSLGGLLGEAP